MTTPLPYDPGSPIAALTHALAAELGEGWSANTDASHAVLTVLDGPNGVRLKVWDFKYTYDRDEPLERVQISGACPPEALDLPEGCTTFKINVGAGRRPSVLVGEIRRRLLPAVEAETARVLARIAERTHNSGSRTAAAHQLAAVLPGGHHAQDEDSSVSSTVRHDHDGITSVWQLRDDGTWVSELTIRNLPVELAMEIAAIIARHRP